MNADPYDDKTDKYFAAVRPEMVRFIPLDAKDVLDVGCGGGVFSAGIKKSRQVRVTGIELFEKAAAAASTRLDEVLHASAEDGLARLSGRLFDCIIFNDVLEHLVDPESTLRAAATLLHPTGVVVASIPNMRHWPVLTALVLRGEWRYADEGILDRTHLRFFTSKSIEEMFKSCGYRIRTLEGINGSELPRKLRMLNRLTSNSFDDTRYLQFAVVATRADVTESDQKGGGER